jgi:Bacteriophage tail sheath protein
MAYLSPGVYVQEVPSSVKAIAGVSTSTPGFIGIVPATFDQIAKDPNGAPDPADPTKIATKFVKFTVTVPAKKPVLITNFAQFAKQFGDLIGDETGAAVTTPTTSTGQHYLAHAVYGFFSNGGSRCWVARIESDTEGLRHHRRDLPGRHARPEQAG